MIALTVSALLLGRHPGRPTAADNPVVWVSTRPSPPAQPPACTSAALKAARGHTGAWHGKATIAIDVTNLGATPCTTAHAPSVTLGVSAGRPVRVDTSTMPTDPIVLPPGGAAELILQSPTSCGRSIHTTTSATLSIRGVAFADLSGVRLPLDCGTPSALEMDSLVPDPATLALP